MSKPDTWMPLYIGDYLKDTARLSTEQHGAYLLLIMDYWSNGPLPDDDDALANVTKLSRALWKKHRGTLQQFFDVSNGCWNHKRIDEEYARALANNAAQRTNGAKGGRPKGVKNTKKKKPTGLVSVTPRANPNESPPPSPISSSYSEEEYSPVASDPNFSPFDFMTKTHGADKAIVKQWFKVREKKKAANTALALEAVVKEAKAGGLNLDEVLRLCCIKSWSGFKLSWDHGLGGKKAESKAWFLSSAEITAKGAEKGIVIGADEAFPYFKQRVYTAYAVTDEMVRNAQADQPPLRAVR